MKHIKHCSVIAALAAAALTFAGVAPAALAANDGATQDAVVATRSFPKTNAVKKNILAEASSTQVESDSDWGGVESLNVPQISSRKRRRSRRSGSGTAASAAGPGSSTGPSRFSFRRSKRPQQQRFLHRDAA